MKSFILTKEPLPSTLVDHADLNHSTNPPAADSPSTEPKPVVNTNLSYNLLAASPVYRTNIHSQHDDLAADEVMMQQVDS